MWIVVLLGGLFCLFIIADLLKWRVWEHGVDNTTHHDQFRKQVKFWMEEMTTATQLWQVADAAIGIMQAAQECRAHTHDVPLITTAMKWSAGAAMSDRKTGILLALYAWAGGRCPGLNGFSAPTKGYMVQQLTAMQQAYPNMFGAEDMVTLARTHGLLANV